MNAPQTTARAANGAPQAARPAAPAPSRMTLAAVTRGPQTQPLRVVIYGPGGIGKTTFGAQAPAPIFLGPESGSALLDVARFPQPETWADVREAVRVLGAEEHPYRTLVIDSLDWLEPLCWQHVCARAGKRSIEDFGFGKGYVAALEEWRAFLAGIERLGAGRGMHVVAIAHGEVKPFKNPEGDDYDRWQLKLHRAAAGLIAEWCDELAFAAFRTHARKVDPNGQRGRGFGSERVLYTERSAAFDAKSRHGLPMEMPLSWEEFFAATQRGASEVTGALRAEIDAVLEKLEPLAPEMAAKARAACEGADPHRLSTYLNTLRARLAQLSAQAASDASAAPSATTND